MLRRAEVGSVIVFARTKHGADRLARALQRRGLSVATLHGNRSQGQRERALLDLRRGRVQILVATDIASRGIDVKDITHIINYDVPHTPEDYVHRIGRTGRVDASGDAFTLMSPDEKKGVVAIERFMGTTILRVMVPDFDYDARSTEPSRSDFAPRYESGSGSGSGSGRSHRPASRGSSSGVSGPSTTGKPEDDGRGGRRPRKALPFERRPRRPR